MMTSLGLGPEALKALAAQCIGSSDFLSREFMHIEDFVAFFLKEGKPEINCVLSVRDALAYYTCLG